VTANGLIGKLRVRKGTALSVFLHVLVLGWGLVSFSARSLEAPPPEDIIPVDVTSDDNISKVTAGMPRRSRSMTPSARSTRKRS
jgi:hypothetical protein